MFTEHKADLPSGPVHYRKGGSGPAILQVSSHWRPGDGSAMHIGGYPDLLARAAAPASQAPSAHHRQ